MSNTSPRRRRLRKRLGLATVAALGLAFVTASTAGANLAGSTFEGNDGNLVVNTAGNTDWANAPARVVGIDQPSGSSDNSFGQGTKEDNANATVVTGSIPPNKNDLTRFYIGSEFASGSNYLYLAWERLVNIGAANMDLEINQNPTAGFTGTTTGPVTLNRTAGDLLVSYDFSGSGTPTLGLLKWVTSGATSQCFASNSLPCWGNRVNLSAAGFAEGAVNTATVTDPVPPGNPRTLTTGLFGEAAINLTAAGVFPSGTCEAFGSTFLKSRASSSFGAEVKDFIAPQPVNITNCGKIIIKKVTVPSPDPTDTSFAFTLNGGGNPAPTGTTFPKLFSLKNGGSDTTLVFAGSGYSAAETVPANWVLTSAVCDDGSPVTNIDVSPSEIVTCTFTNTLQLGAIEVTKLSSKGNTPLAGATFTVSTNPVTTLTTGADGTACVDNLFFGTYTVTETSAPTGYKIDNPNPVSVTVDHNATCASGTPNAPAAFTDTPLSKITVSFQSKAGPGVTSATIQCTGDASSAPLPEGTPKVLDDLVPGTYTCTVVVDP
jgi:hypothetical protein